MGFGLFPLHPAEAASVRMKEMTSGRKRIQQYVTVLLIGLLALEASALTPREGPVRADGHAVADAKGAFNALGATLFWGAWGYKFDRPRLERNFGVLRTAGVDYVRVLGSVGGTSWEDRQTDPRWSDYDAIIAGMTDLAYDRYGLRVQWTLFGGAPYTPAGPAREALVDRFAALARGREHKLFAFEIANEAWQNGFPGPEVPRSCAASAPGSRNGHRYSWRSALHPQERRVPHMQVRVPTPSRSTTRADSAKKVRPRHFSVPGRFPARMTRNAGDSSHRSSLITSR